MGESGAKVARESQECHSSLERPQGRTAGTVCGAVSLCSQNNCFFGKLFFISMLKCSRQGSPFLSGGRVGSTLSLFIWGNERAETGENFFKLFFCI